MEIDFSLPAPVVARQLIGTTLCAKEGTSQIGGVIIETEAYTRDDPASHSFRGITKRNKAMFMAPGTLYVYQSYGLHLCLNIVTGASDGQAVLIRAIKPTIGVDLMWQKRGYATKQEISNGPGKVAQALGVTQDLNGKRISQTRLKLLPATMPYGVAALPRIGVTKAVDQPWRFQATETKK